MNSNANAYAVELLRKKPRVFWGRVVYVFIKQGWNPPRPDQRVTDAILRGIEDAFETGASLSLDRTINTELTIQELKILILIVEGATNPEIGVQLEIAPATVKFHVTNLLEKMGARNRAHAVALAFRTGLVK